MASTVRKVTAPNKLYLRGIEDLTLHGGIDYAGRLVVLPVYSGLGTKGLKANEYLPQVEAFWNSGRLTQVLAGHHWKPGKANFYHVRYPALTAILPLPSAAVIDQVLNEGNTDVASRELAKAQLVRCGGNPRWRVFRLLGEDITNNRLALDALLAAEAISPGLLTKNFREVLEAIQNFHTIIDTAEASRQFLAMDGCELLQIFSLACGRDCISAGWQEAKNWSGFYKGLQDWSSRVRSNIANSKGRLYSSDNESLLRHLYKQQGTVWAMLADVGAEAILEFARSVDAARKQGSISSPIMSVDQNSRGALTTAIRETERGGSDGLGKALGLGWLTVIGRGIDQECYRRTELHLPELSQAWAQRFRPESSFASLVSRAESRPIAEGGLLVVRTDTAAPIGQGARFESDDATVYVRIEPAILKPQVAAIRSTSRAKKFSSLADRYLSLSAALRLGIERKGAMVPSLYIDEREQILWPQGHVWQAVDMAKTLASHPQLFYCPEVLATGCLRLPTERWDELGLTQAKLAVSNSVGPTWERIHDWFSGISLSHPSPLGIKKQNLYSDSYTNLWPMVMIDGGIAVADVRLGVRFVQTGSSPLLGDSTSIALLLRDIARSMECSGEPLKAMSDLLSGLRDDLRFEARPFFDVDGRNVDETEWFSAVKTKTGYYRLGCGLVIDAAAYLAKTDQFILRKRVYAKFQNLRLGDIWSVQRTVLAESTSGLSPDEYIRQLSIQISPVLKELDAQSLGPISDILLAEKLADLAQVLRPYQAEGLAWGYLRFHLGFGVCIADEMGLGKTLQAIALLRTLHDAERPSLVVMPKTLLYNWQREVASFGSGLKVAVYGEGEKGETPDVWLVTYPRLRVHQELLTGQEWNVVVLDEAQAIKNSDTQVAEAANLLQARYRLALTGTPVENRAAELWSIINWLNPGYLGSQADFSAYTLLARSSEQKAALLAPLRESLDPLILRRRKSDPRIALGLPDKIHLDLACELSEEQTILYESVIETVLAEESLGSKGFARRAIFLKAILHLKQICIHPDLFYGKQDEEEIVAEIDAETAVATRKIRQLVLNRLQSLKKSSSFDGWLARSGKLSVVRELILALRMESSGILIFTQYLGVADLLRRALSHGKQETIGFIHGGLSASSRLELVDEFNDSCRLKHANEPCPILILSIKAGGTGLNLTGADRVIHFDRWWNPAVEDQATDRAHRIGQERTVFAHTVTSQGTIEDAIGRIFVEKRSLAEDLLGAASVGDVGELLKSRDGFLDLVDPRQIYTKRLTGQQPNI